MNLSEQDDLNPLFKEAKSEWELQNDMKDLAVTEHSTLTKLRTVLLIARHRLMMARMPEADDVPDRNE